MKQRIILALVTVIVLATVGFISSGKPDQSATSIQPTRDTQRNKAISNEKHINSTLKTSAGVMPDIRLKSYTGFVIHKFASGVEGARDLEFSPGGTLLVSDPAGNKVMALPDKDNDGSADSIKTIIAGENHVHGIAFYEDKLYIADVDKVVRYNWDEKSLTAKKDNELFALPQNNNHNNRSIIFDKSGQMFVSSGSTCNACIEGNKFSGAILLSDKDGRAPQVYASGLRNSPFLAFRPDSNELWATEMGRDHLGDDIPPDEINVIKKGGNYGWPYCYGDRVHDDVFDPNKTYNCTSTMKPAYDIPAHSAPLGLTFVDSDQFPTAWQGDLLVAFHGSWNRSKPAGYKVVHLKMTGGTVTGSEDFIAGFAPDEEVYIAGYNNIKAINRPVDLIFDKAGNLYLSDDKGGNIFIIRKNDIK